MSKRKKLLYKRSLQPWVGKTPIGNMERALEALTVKPKPSPKKWRALKPK